MHVKIINQMFLAPNLPLLNVKNPPGCPGGVGNASGAPVRLEKLEPLEGKAAKQPPSKLRTWP